jgi:hypothetical protein
MCRRVTEVGCSHPKRGAQAETKPLLPVLQRIDRRMGNQTCQRLSRLYQLRR